MTSIRALTLACIAVALAHPIGAQTRKPRPRHPVAPKPPATHVTSGLQAITTPSGLTYVITHRGTGRHPNAGETVLVNYVGSLLNGKKFDSSYDRNEPLAFPIGKARVIKGWDEGIALMGIGDQAILIVPPDLGYGNRDLGNGLIPPNSTMVFVLELVDVKTSSVSQVLEETIATKGIDAAVAQYRELRSRGFGDIYANEGELNGLGYALLGRHQVNEAIEILKLNVEAYPKSSNAYDSLGEAYLAAGARPQAIENYERSLELDPSNKNAADVLTKLKAQ